MRSFCVSAWRRLFAARFVFGALAAIIATIAVGISDAEAARRKKRVYQPYAPPYASIVYDVNSGKVLQETNANALRHPASVTKVMTLYLLFEQLEKGRFKLDSQLRVSAEAASQSPSKLGLRAGETIAVEDAIKALVTKSANDIAVVVAEAIGGDEETFGDMMTKKARAIGMSRSVFRNASGLPNPEQVTTARDLVTLGRAIHDRFPRYYTYFSTRTFNYDGDVYRNHNRLLGKIEGVDGIKTGYTRASGFNLLSSAKTDGRHLITVVLGGRSARSRDANVAALIEDHMPRAFAGRRKTDRSVEVAAVEPEEQAPAPALRRALPEPRTKAPINEALPTTIAALPPTRPKTAVIAEVDRSQDMAPNLTKGRPLALSSSGSTNAMQAGTTPMAFVATTPRSPAMRWVASPQGADPSRPVPPGSVRYTNSLPTTPVGAEPDQPLPDLPKALTSEAKPSDAQKVEERLPSIGTRAAISAQTPMVAPAQAPIKAATAKPESVAVTAPQPEKPKLVATAPARSGWVIQLGAAESDAKARALLEKAKEGNSRLLKEAEPFTESVAKGDATLYRARFAGFDADEAQSACKQLKRSGFNCFAQKL